MSLSRDAIYWIGIGLSRQSAKDRFFVEELPDQLRDRNVLRSREFLEGRLFGRCDHHFDVSIAVRSGRFSHYGNHFRLMAVMVSRRKRY